MWQNLRALLFNPRTLLIVYIGAAIFAAAQLYLLGTHPFVMPKPGSFPDDIMNHPNYMNLFIGHQMTEYNNYLIFKYSFFHLLDGKNLYDIYPERHWDFYKYSPTFALFMGGIAWLPDLLGLSIWNILNAITVYLAIRMLPFTTKVQCLVMWFIAMELLTCLQNTQSNGLMCGLMIAAYGSMQRGKPIWATLWLVLAAYIKVYSVIGFCLFLFYPGKPKFIAWAIIWTVVLFALPLVVTPFHTLVWQYQNWAALMLADASAALGLSVVGWLHSWFGISNAKTIVTAVGALLFLLPLIRFKMYRNEAFKILMLASMLIWVIIFNHKAESSTYIIAVAGVAIWYYARPKANWRLAILLLVFIFTSLGTTDIFPPFVRQHFIYPYTIKAFPCIVAWCAVFIELMLLKPILPEPAPKYYDRAALN
jgi:hypothetical protein